LPADLLCFSHLRWDFVYQRPNHLMARAAKSRRVFFIEEPIALDATDRGRPRLDRVRRERVTVLTPRLPAASDPATSHAALAGLLNDLVSAEHIDRPVRWYYTPMALPWSEGIPASAVVYDCMDDLSGFRDPPAGLLALEQRLISVADLLFTGGKRLYESKGAGHPDRHLFPSSVDRRHFEKARQPQVEPADQASIPHPRLGYFGVVDERMDMPLLADLADRRPEWQIVLVGPIAKIDSGDIPARPNVHHLGHRPYAQLPAYLAGWDVAIMPFAHNSATRFISPTKTPEYLAGGRPVASTSIADVVEPYGRLGLVEVGDGAAFEAAVERALATDRRDLERRVDAFLDGMSWDQTWAAMSALIERAASRDRAVRGVADGSHEVARIPTSAPGRRAAIANASGRPAAVTNASRRPTAVANSADDEFRDADGL
jgi:UDP-galactopyranose mutase